MTNREKLEELLAAHDGEFVSGAAIAAELGISRTAVWKAVRQLEESGYAVEAVKNRGYRLTVASDPISESSILRYLGENSGYTLEVHDSIGSTNTELKKKADRLPDQYVILSAAQTAGRGRIGRSFYSPSGTGVYLSVLLHPSLPAAEATRITTAAAVAACRAIEACTDAQPQIKWVNDVYVNEKKTCGILTEGSFNMETGGLDWAVMGIGFNVYEPEGGFPKDIAAVAGAISVRRMKDLRSRLAAAFLLRFRELCANLHGADFAEEYRRRCFVPGKRILVLRGGTSRPALALSLDDACGLRVRYDDGSEETLSSGEVSIRPEAEK